MSTPTLRPWLRTILPIGLGLSPPTHAVRKPRRASAYATLYSPPPTHTSSVGENSIRPYPGGDSRIMQSPRETRSNLAWFAGRIVSTGHCSFRLLVVVAQGREM